MHFFFFRKTIRKLPGDVIREVPLPEPELTDGFGSREQAGRLCRKMGVKSVLVVTDRTIHGLGFHEKILSSLLENDIPFSVFCDIDSEPTVEIIAAGRKAALECGADCLIALGGGSVMDASKVIAACTRNPKRSVRWHLQKFDYVPGKTLPIITIPTTAGTGAEYTVGAVVKNARGVKHSTVIIGLNVRHVILDSELMVNAPAHMTVWCGIAPQEDTPEEAADKMIDALRQLLDTCGLEKACVEMREKDYPQLVKMIDADSINYSPSKTFSDQEIIRLLDRIRKGEEA